MPEEYRNIYKTARRSAGLTQEAAAERLDLSVESIRAYETGSRIPPNDVVERMVECYGLQYLAYQHLKETNALMGRVVPELTPRGLMEAVVRLTNRINRFGREHSADRLLEIAEDGRITDAERTEFEEIVADLREIVRVGLELDVFCGRKEDGTWESELP